MDKETLIQVALTGIVTFSSAVKADGLPPASDIVLPRPIEEICKILEESEDGKGLDQDILDFLNTLESQGRVLECSTIYAEGNTGDPTEWPGEEITK